MVFGPVGAVQTGFAGFFDDGQKMAELRVFQHTDEFARGPKFLTGGIDALDALERVTGGRE